MIDKDFLKGFRKRMQFVARYAMLCGNSIDRVVKWRSFGINTRDEQMNMIFSILLYVMEYSLREEDCTMDDIASFVDDINYEYYERPAGYEESKNLARFVIEEILGNSGVSMYFKAYDYEDKEYKNINIRYIDNKVVYQDGGVKRTSYYLTNEGYNMVLSTMEVENNLKLTINEMLFKLHLEKADYNKAVDDIKNIFNQLRKQGQKILEAAKSGNQSAFLASFGRPDEPFPTLLAKAVNMISFWYEGEEKDGVLRNLTPVECERLMGLPEGWTAYGNLGQPIRDNARCKALGNAIALPCADYIMAGIAETIHE